MTPHHHHHCKEADDGAESDDAPWEEEEDDFIAPPVRRTRTRTAVSKEPVLKEPVLKEPVTVAELSETDAGSKNQTEERTEEPATDTKTETVTDAATTAEKQSCPSSDPVIAICQSNNSSTIPQQKCDVISAERNKSKGVVVAAAAALPTISEQLKEDDCSERSTADTRTGSTSCGQSNATNGMTRQRWAPRAVPRVGAFRRRSQCKAVTGDAHLDWLNAAALHIENCSASDVALQAKPQEDGPHVYVTNPPSRLVNQKLTGGIAVEGCRLGLGNAYTDSSETMPWSDGTSSSPWPARPCVMEGIEPALLSLSSSLFKRASVKLHHTLQSNHANDADDAMMTTTRDDLPEESPEETETADSDEQIEEPPPKHKNDHAMNLSESSEHQALLDELCFDERQQRHRASLAAVATELLPLHTTNSTAVGHHITTEYIPYLRTICANESIRQAAGSSRRRCFIHWLTHTNVALSDDPIRELEALSKEPISCL